MPKSSGVPTFHTNVFVSDLFIGPRFSLLPRRDLTHFFYALFFFLLSIFADWPQTSVNRHLMFNLYFFLFTNGKAICTECLYLFALKNKGLIVGYDGGMSDSF